MLREQESTSRVALFGGHEIRYDDGVLTPRPWTQAQSWWARDLLAQAPSGRVLEVCAGAGHIGLLAVEDTGRDLVQVDADVRACTWALRNARDWEIDSEIRCGSMLDVLAAEERFALIIADPPWVPSGRVQDFPQDPVSVIDGGEDGLDLARMCLDVIARHLARAGVALLQLRDLEQGRVLRPAAAERGLAITEGREFDGGAVVLLRRATEGHDMSEPLDDETIRGRAEKLADLPGDPDDDDGTDDDGTESVPGVEGPEGVPDLPVPDDPGTGGPGEDD